MHVNHGIFVEDALKSLLHNKKIKDISNNLKHMLQEMFGLLDENEIIICQKPEKPIKPDLFISYKGIEHAVSIKTGRSTLLHSEPIKDFVLFLRSIGVSKKTQQTILLFHYGDGTMDGSGAKRLGYQEIAYRLKDRIIDANKELNKDSTISQLVVERCIFQGVDKDATPADYVYFGDEDYGVITSRIQIEKHLLRKRWLFYENLHIGPILLRTAARYSNQEIRSEKNHNRVQCYWPNYCADLEYISRRYNG